MAIAIDLSVTADVEPAVALATVRRLSCWDDFVGVRLLGVLDRPLDVGDDVDVAVDVAGRTIGVRCTVVVVSGGSVELRTTAGPLDATVVGTVTSAAGGRSSVLRLAVEGRARGPARLLERPLEAIGRRWAAHQVAHLARTAAEAGGGRARHEP